MEFSGICATIADLCSSPRLFWHAHLEEPRSAPGLSPFSPPVVPAACLHTYVCGLQQQCASPLTLLPTYLTLTDGAAKENGGRIGPEASGLKLRSSWQQQFSSCAATHYLRLLSSPPYQFTNSTSLHPAETWIARINFHAIALVGPANAPRLNCVHCAVQVIWSVKKTSIVLGLYHHSSDPEEFSPMSRLLSVTSPYITITCLQ